MPNDLIHPRPPEFTPNPPTALPFVQPSVPEIRLAEAVILTLREGDILLVRVPNLTAALRDRVHAGIHAATDHLPFKVKALVCAAGVEISTLRADMILP